MTDRYPALFDRLAGVGEGAFGAFVMLGDPDLERGADILDALVAGGADMIEVGIPFSDPVADGPVIQASAARALGAGVRPADCFAMIRAFRARHPDVPLGILTYANLVVARGRDAFYRAAAEAGADSVLVADVPLIEAAPFVASARTAGVASVLIAASNTPFERLQRIAGTSQGYVYCVSRPGVTGADGTVRFAHSQMLRTLRDHRAPPPIFGFGISRPEHVAAALAAGAAGAICGSAIVSLIAAGRAEQIPQLVASLKRATRGHSRGREGPSTRRGEETRASPSVLTPFRGDFPPAL